MKPLPNVGNGSVRTQPKWPATINVSFINSLCVERDAISMAVRDEMAALRTVPGVNAKLFTYRCDISDVHFLPVETITDIAFDRHFQTSDIVIAHYGVRYPLFNVLPLTPRRATRIVVFHNVTPIAHSPRSGHDGVAISLRQISNAQWADHVICDSETNLETLREMGVTTAASVLPLAVHGSPRPPETKPSGRDGVVRIAFVGRFVKSKGVTDLLHALAALLGRGALTNVRLVLIGNTEFSSPSTLARMQNQIDALRRDVGRHLSVELVADASDEHKTEVLRESDLFVLPTYHEGFCVPILEAIAAGCRVITYDNSNTARIGGGLTTLVPTGDLERLAATIESATADVRSEAWHGPGQSGYRDYVERAQRHVDYYAPAVVHARFRDAVVSIRRLTVPEPDERWPIAVEPTEPA